MTPQTKENSNMIFTLAALPDCNGGYTLCPELLTEDETIRYLRLDTIGHKNPSNTLRYYRSKHLLIATRIGKGVLYARKELDLFIDKMTQDNFE